MATTDTLDRWSPGSMTQPAANFATPDTRNTVDPVPVMDFDASTNETIILTGIMPANYDGTTGVTVKTHWAMSSATSGNIDVDVSFELPADLDTSGFAAAISTDNTTVPATSGEPFVVSTALTDGAEIDSVTAGNFYRIKITRDAVSDTAAGDAELIYVELQET